jgi:hypothetical protein
MFPRSFINRAADYRTTLITEIAAISVVWKSVATLKTAKSLFGNTSSSYLTMAKILLKYEILKGIFILTLVD